MSSAPIGIALLGCGTVGGGVLRILRDEADHLADRTGLRFDVRQVVVRDPSRPRDNLPPSAQVGTDAHAAIHDPAVKIVVELIGGTTAAHDLVARAIAAGKPVVTANKSLLATHGPELFGAARRAGLCIAFEASCGGGIPIIDALMRGLAGNRIDAMVGIVNGTCNYILTRMTKAGLPYAAALAEAQAAGFAEADPAMDVSGRDAAQKLALLAGLAFGCRVREADVTTSGIDGLDAADIGFARDLGYVIKLLATAKRVGPKLSLRVQPTLVAREDVLAEVGGSFNAVGVYGHALGHALFYGRGAGAMPTASAVVADLVGVASGVTPLLAEGFRFLPDQVGPATVLPPEKLESRYYLRLRARDEPGVLARVTDALGRQGISLGAVLQREVDTGRHVPVVITTHTAREGAIRAALGDIDAMDVIAPPTVCLRIHDAPREFGDA